MQGKGDERGVKIRIVVDEKIEEDAVIIQCRTLSPAVRRIEQAVAQSVKKVSLTFYRGSTEYFFPVETVLFFETAENAIDAHTADSVFQVKTRLYALEEILPRNFVRISKSTIVNTEQIYSIDKNLASAGSIHFNNTHKQVYVSRKYYRNLKERITERRSQNE